MQRILILSDNSFSLWQFRRELLTTMLHSGIDVLVAVPAGPRTGQLTELGCRLIDTTLAHHGKDSQLTDRYVQILKAEQPDMVVTYGTRCNICGGFACQKTKTPYCANVQGLGSLDGQTVGSFLQRLSCRIALKQAKAVFFENAANAAFFQEHKLMPEARQVILPGAGVNLRHYALQPYPDNDPIRFLYVGPMRKEKGTDELLSAIKMLYDDCYEVRLDLVGDQDESYAEQLQLLKAQGIVVTHGFQEDARPFYAACDCVVMPSHAEGMSNVLLEGAATGRPVIASYIPGCREAVDEARTGFTCRTQDKYALYDAMKRIARMDRSQREEMGRQGRARMEEMFDKLMVVEDTMNAIFQQ